MSRKVWRQPDDADPGASRKCVEELHRDCADVVRRRRRAVACSCSCHCRPGFNVVTDQPPMFVEDES